MIVEEFEKYTFAQCGLYNSAVKKPCGDSVRRFVVETDDKGNPYGEFVTYCENSYQHKSAVETFNKIRLLVTEFRQFETYEEMRQVYNHTNWSKLTATINHIKANADAVPCSLSLNMRFICIAKAIFPEWYPDVQLLEDVYQRTLNIVTERRESLARIKETIQDKQIWYPSAEERAQNL